VHLSDPFEKMERNFKGNVEIQESRKSCIGAKKSWFNRWVFTKDNELYVCLNESSTANLAKHSIINPTLYTKKSVDNGRIIEIGRSTQNCLLRFNTKQACADCFEQLIVLSKFVLPTTCTEQSLIKLDENPNVYPSSGKGLVRSPSKRDVESFLNNLLEGLSTDSSIETSGVSNVLWPNSKNRESAGNLERLTNNSNPEAPFSPALKSPSDLKTFSAPPTPMGSLPMSPMTGWSSPPPGANTTWNATPIVSGSSSNHSWADEARPLSAILEAPVVPGPAAVAAAAAVAVNTAPSFFDDDEPSETELLSQKMAATPSPSIDAPINSDREASLARMRNLREAKKSNWQMDALDALKLIDDMDEDS